MLSAVLEHKNKHRMVFYTALLTATKTAKWRITGRLRSAFWGRGEEEGLDHWQGIFRQLVVLNYLQKGGETYGVFI